MKRSCERRADEKCEAETYGDITSAIEIVFALEEPSFVLISWASFVVLSAE
jgi:hypothetical protein